MPPKFSHAGLLVVLLLHLALSLTFAGLTPLGEAPDEPAHVSYARFIARQQRLPATLEERREAGYRAAWPPLYHLLAAAPIALVGDAPPTQLKAVGDTPRRLLPTNGQTIASFVHTLDEAWPWRGITLAWRLSRLVSLLLTALAVSLTYLIAWQLTRNRRLATGAAAIHAFWPQALFVGTTVTDDALLIFLAALVLFVVVRYTNRSARLSLGHFVLLGALLGLALVTKYNALPLLALVLVWLIWLAVTAGDTGPPSVPPAGGEVLAPPPGRGRLGGGLAPPPGRGRLGGGLAPPPGRERPGGGLALLALFSGMVLTGGWWFGFIWQHFNQIDRLGLIRGSLAALSAGASDASLRRLADGHAISLPPLAAWPAWLAQLFQSTWGLFGGGGTIPLPGWSYGLLLLVSLLAAVGLGRAFFISAGPQRLYLFLLTPLFFLPLPVVRFALSGSLVETAQGRHLFPALPALALALAWGLAHLPQPERTRQRRWLLPLLLAGFLFGLSLFSLFRIRASYPPLIPLRTTPDGFDAAQPLAGSMAAGIELIGYDLGPPEANILPLELLWQASAIPAEDYLIDITVIDAGGQVVGGWRGQFVGGRYPGRAWDEGDFLRDTIPLPLLPRRTASELTVRLRLLDFEQQPAGQTVSLPSAPPPAAVSGPFLLRPAALRADGLAPDAPFSYRATISVGLPNGSDTPLELLAPDGRRFAPELRFSGAEAGIAHFIVGADWPSGDYFLDAGPERLTVPVDNRPRRFEPPPMQQRVEANFANRLTLLGYDLPQRRVAPGDSFPVTLHLQARRTMAENLAIFNHLLDRQAVQRGGVDRIPQNFYTTLLWVPGEIVSDAYDVPVDADAPPGVYWLDVGFYPGDRPDLSLPLVENGQPVERSSVAIGPLKVGGPPPGVVIENPQPGQPVNHSLGQQISLLGYTLTGPAGQPGDDPAASIEPAGLTLYWRADGIPPADYTVFVHLLGPDGQLVAQADGPPAGGAYPTSLWDPGEIIRDDRPLPALPPGQYHLLVGLYRPDTGARLPVEGTVDNAVRLVLTISALAD